MTSNNSENQPINPEASLVNVNPIAKIGASLKEAREKQNMSCAFLAASLRMGQEQLRALEEGNIKSLPEEVYIKAMIRRVAERLRLNADELIKELDISSENSYQGVNDKNKFNQNKDLILKNLKNRWKPISLFFGIFTITLVVLLGNNLLQRKNQNDNDISIEDSIENRTQIQKNNSEKEIKISSLKPTKATIKNGLGQILFEGTIKEPLKYSLNNGLEIYAYRPDLIEIESEGMINTILGSNEDIKWHDLSSMVRP